MAPLGNIETVVTIAVASAAAIVAGAYNYWKSSSDPEARARARSIPSFEESGSLQRKYLDEFKKDLGEKRFFLGEQMTSTDLQIFGQLASIYYVPNTETVVNLLNEKYPTLVAWMERVSQQICRKDFSISSQ